MANSFWLFSNECNCFFFRLPCSFRVLNQHSHKGQGEVINTAIKQHWNCDAHPADLIMCSTQLAAIKLGRYGEDLLFYLYYMNGGDLLQLLAAVELYVVLIKSFFSQTFFFGNQPQVDVERLKGTLCCIAVSTGTGGTIKRKGFGLQEHLAWSPR